MPSKSWLKICPKTCERSVRHNRVTIEHINRVLCSGHCSELQIESPHHLCARTKSNCVRDNYYVKTANYKDVIESKIANLLSVRVGNETTSHMPGLKKMYKFLMTHTIKFEC